MEKEFSPSELEDLGNSPTEPESVDAETAPESAEHESRPEITGEEVEDGARIMLTLNSLSRVESSRYITGKYGHDKGISIFNKAWPIYLERRYAKEDKKNRFAEEFKAKRRQVE